MARTSRADSTEALLDVIREGDEQQLNFRGAGKSAPERKPPKRKEKKPAIKVKGAARGPGFLGMARNAVLGVDIGSDHITVVRMSASEPRRLLNIQTVTLDSGAGLDDPAFPAKLRQVVGRVSRGACALWALYRAADVDIGTVQVPRMTGAKLSNMVYWQLQKERKFSDEEFVLDYRVQRQFKEGEVLKTEVLTCLARRKDVERLQRVFASAGYHLQGMTVIPAAFQNIYRTGWAPSGDGLTASLHVGATFSCITIYEGADIRFSRTIKFGIDSMAEELAESCNNGQIPGVAALPAAGRMNVETGRQVLLAKLLDRQISRSTPGAVLSEEAVFEAVQESLERVARQAERTLGYYAQNFHQRCERLHLSGRIFGCKRVADYISGELALEMSVFDPLGGLDLSGLTSFSSLSERMVMNEAVATALSDPEQTLNLTHNYAARQRDQTGVRISNFACVGLMVLALTLAGVFIWGKETAKSLQMEAASLKSRLVETQQVDQAVLARTVAAAVAQQQRLRSISERYEGLAVLVELERLTPERVRLLNLSMELAKPESSEPGGAAPSKGASVPVRLVVVNAIILGDKSNFETDLTRYLIGLKSSPLFGDVLVQESSVKEFQPEGDVFHVVLHLQLA